MILGAPLSEQRNEGQRSVAAGEPVELPDGCRVAQCEGGWHVADSEGYFLDNLDDNSWSDDRDDPLTFAAQEEAVATF